LYYPGKDLEFTNPIREHLVNVGIQKHPLEIGRRHEIIPVADRLEGIMDHNDVVAFYGGTVVWVAIADTNENIGGTDGLEEIQIPNDFITITPVLFTCKHRPRNSLVQVYYLFGHIEYLFAVETCRPNKFSSIRICVYMTTI
jgi:hypothetical protein